MAVTAVLLGGGILMHWPVGTVFWAIALLFGLLLVPGARAARGASEPWWTSRPARVFGAAGAGLAMGGLPLLLTPARTCRTAGPVGSSRATWNDSCSGTGSRGSSRPSGSRQPSPDGPSDGTSCSCSWPGSCP